jgi:hypothetical protein
MVFGLDEPHHLLKNKFSRKINLRMLFGTEQLKNGLLFGSDL